MAKVSRRLRTWGWLTRRMAPVATMDEAGVIALQSRLIPDNAVTRWLFGAVPPGVEVADRAVPGPAGDIKVRVYRRSAGNRPGAEARPLVLYFHGGGFVLGNLDMGNWICGTVAARVGAVVVSVDYRLAPTHRFPAAVEDCYAAFAWTAEHAAEFGAAPSGPVGVMGESAGGNLAAVTCLLARDRGGPSIAHQALVYPVADMTDEHQMTAGPTTPFLTDADIAAYHRFYFGSDGDPANPLASPLLAEHAGLPPALIQVGEHDPLRDGGKRYADALRAAGVPVRLTEYTGMPHGFVNFPGLSQAAHQALSEVCAEQAAAFTTHGQLDDVNREGAAS
jgi:acetyl esterase/lipase